MGYFFEGRLETSFKMWKSLNHWNHFLPCATKFYILVLFKDISEQGSDFLKGLSICMFTRGKLLAMELESYWFEVYRRNAYWSILDAASKETCWWDIKKEIIFVNQSSAFCTLNIVIGFLMFPGNLKTFKRWTVVWQSS